MRAEESPFAFRLLVYESSFRKVDLGFPGPTTSEK